MRVFFQGRTKRKTTSSAFSFWGGPSIKKTNPKKAYCTSINPSQFQATNENPSTLPRPSNRTKLIRCALIQLNQDMTHIVLFMPPGNQRAATKQRKGVAPLSGLWGRGNPQLSRKVWTRQAREAGNGPGTRTVLLSSAQRLTKRILAPGIVSSCFVFVRTVLF